MLQVFTDAVEDDDRIMYREADHGQHGGNKQTVDLPVEEIPQDGEDSEDYEHVMQQGDHGAGAIFQSLFETADGEAEGKVEDDQPGGIDDSLEGIRRQLFADGAA